MEQWKDIVGYEGRYAISNKGNVWSYKRQINLKTPPDNRGYSIVSLIDDNGVQRTKKVHRLVAEHFIPNPFGLETVNHKDEDKRNNDVDNLEWMTRGDNIRYGTGIERSAKGRSKAIYCIELDKVFESLTKAAQELDISCGNLSMAVRSASRTCGGYHWRYAFENE